MAVTANDQRDRGQPTLWSAAVDALAAGRAFDSSRRGLVYIDDDSLRVQRLFVISAGNVAQLEKDHLVRSDLEAVEDPAHAWNALTVGACTERAVLHDPQWISWHPLAEPGELSPFSTTSVLFAKSWPAKPDVVFEGGNVAVNAKGEVDFPVGGLSLLTTYFKPAQKQFVLTWATSAACAQVPVYARRSLQITQSPGPRPSVPWSFIRLSGLRRCSSISIVQAARRPVSDSSAGTALAFPVPSGRFAVPPTRLL